MVFHQFMGESGRPYRLCGCFITCGAPPRGLKTWGLCDVRLKVNESFAPYNLKVLEVCFLVA